MPLNIDFLQVLLHMLNFVILAGGLTLLLFKPIGKFLNDRTAHFETLERENAEKAAENERLKAEYEQKLQDAETEIAARRAQAEKEMSDAASVCIDSAKEKAAACLHAAEKEAEERKTQILDSAQAEIGDLVVSAAQKLLSETATPEHDSMLYDAFIHLAEKSTADKGNAE